MPKKKPRRRKAPQELTPEAIAKIARRMEPGVTYRAAGGKLVPVGQQPERLPVSLELLGEMHKREQRAWLDGFGSRGIEWTPMVFTKAMIARLLGVTVRQLDAMIRTGEIEVRKITREGWRVRLDTLDPATRKVFCD